MLSKYDASKFIDKKVQDLMNSYADKFYLDEASIRRCRQHVTRPSSRSTTLPSVSPLLALFASPYSPTLHSPPPLSVTLCRSISKKSKWEAYKKTLLNDMMSKS